MESNSRTGLDALRAQVDYPTSYRPEKPGDAVAGEAIAWSDFEKTDERSGERKSCRILTIRDEAGVEHAVWCWHSVLRNELAGVVPGDLVAISYGGKRQRKSGDGSYHSYRVAVQHNEAGGVVSSADSDIPF
jgi:hypothetical protein